MEGSAVNIACALLHDKVLPHRPPSGKRERDKIINNYARQLSSTVAKNYRPGSAVSRGRSQSPSPNVRLFVKVEPPQNNKKSKNDDIANSKGADSASRRRRVQSAKARLTNSETTQSKPKLERRHSAKVRWGTSDSKLVRHNSDFRPDSKRTENERLEPSISSYKDKRRICRSESDLSKLDKPLKSCLKGSSQNIGSTQSSFNAKTEEELTDEALGVLVDDEDTDDETEGVEYLPDEDIRLPLPKTLQPLAHWWTPDIPPDYLGIDHLRCWVFLPSMLKDYEDLPVVPRKVSDPTEELPYKEIIHEPAPWAPKKYPHPWTKRPVNDWTCKHGHNTSVPPLEVYSTEGKLVHDLIESRAGSPYESCTNLLPANHSLTSHDRRTVGVVRREILELEQLMRGIGSAGGCSLVVRYQHEINQLQDMVDSTLGRVEEIEKREREKQEALERQIKDYCGLRKFCKEHDEVMRQIRIQHSRCVRELAILERGLKLDSDRAHFRKRHKTKEINNSET